MKEKTPQKRLSEQQAREDVEAFDQAAKTEGLPSMSEHKSLEDVQAAEALLREGKKFRGEFFDVSQDEEGYLVVEKSGQPETARRINYVNAVKEKDEYNDGFRFLPVLSGDNSAYLSLQEFEQVVKKFKLCRFEWKGSSRHRVAVAECLICDRKYSDATVHTGGGYARIPKSPFDDESKVRYSSPVHEVDPDKVKAQAVQCDHGKAEASFEEKLQKTRRELEQGQREFQAGEVLLRVSQLTSSGDDFSIKYAVVRGGRETGWGSCQLKGFIEELEKRGN